MLSGFELICQSFPLFLQGAGTTLLAWFLGVPLGGALIALILGIASCNRYKTMWVTIPVTIYVFIVRGTPLFVQILLSYFVLPELLGINLSPLAAGVLVLAFASGAYLTEIIQNGINAISPGQWEAAHVLGLSQWATLRYVIMPQVMRIAFVPFLNQADAFIKSSSLISAIGLMELTKVGMTIVSRNPKPMAVYGVVALMYIFMSTTFNLTGKALYKRYFQH